jgi:EAL domain-containing protein (putative c-di-GMP-specific phosphodiesterase class I)
MRKKRTGKEHTIEEDPDAKYWDERYIIDSYKTALEQHWFKVYYQPIVRISNRKMVSLEALARWIDPVRGTIPPSEFIPILSRMHRLYMLDLYMVEEVCREFGIREEAGLPLLPVSVNISAQDFDYVDVPEKLKEITDKYGVSRDSIIVEITEQDIAEGEEPFKEALERIREYGFRLWTDDFGSGYSSLGVLSQYKVDRIKFDMALVQHLDDNDGANRKIMEAMVGVCREMNVGTLAEGVETKEQLEFLESIGCDLAQGFYLFKPDPTDVSIFKFKNRKEDIPYEILV